MNIIERVSKNVEVFRFVQSPNFSLKLRRASRSEKHAEAWTLNEDENCLNAYQLLKGKIMGANISTIETRKNYPSAVSADTEIYYPDTDETIMPEGIQHFLLSVHLASTLLAFFASRNDAKVFGNVMLYYEEGKPKKFISPDLMVCFGLAEFPKRVYKLWEEKVVPSVVVEFASNTTWFNDVSTKLALYQKLGVKEYYVYDIEYAHLPEPLMAYRLDDDVLSEIEVKDRRILSESLGLELVDTGKTLRFFDPQTQKFLMTMEETQAENEELKRRLAELEKQNDGK